MGQGELFALTPEVLNRLIAGVRRSDIMDEVHEIEDFWEEEYRLPCWKTWVEIHYCLTGGTCDPRGGPEPLNRCLLGSRHLTNPDEGYIAALLFPEEVPSTVAALDELSTEWLRRRYA